MLYLLLVILIIDHSDKQKK